MSQEQTIARNYGSAGVRCPDCESAIEPKSMNITEGVALCLACGKLTRLSELIRGGRTSRELLVAPPEKCSISQFGQAVEVEVSLRSIPGAIFMSIFALIWNGGTITMALSNLNLLNNNAGFGIFSILFSIPFIAIGIGVAVVALLSIFGKVFVVIDEAGCYAATGFDLVNWKRRFLMQKVRSIEITDSLWQSEGRHHKMIKIEADHVVKIIAAMDDDARSWMVSVLRYLLMPDNREASSTLMQRWQTLQAKQNVRVDQ